MNGTHHQGSVRCSCWHSTNPRIILSGGDDRTIRLWRLYPHNSLYQSSNSNNKNQQHSNITTPKLNAVSTKIKATASSSDNNDSEDSVELRYDQQQQQHLSDDDDPTNFITDFDPSIQPTSHLLSMPASGEVKGICMSPYNGEILAAISSRLFNQKSSLDIFCIPHWTWNYSSRQRVPYKMQLRQQEKHKMQLQESNLSMAENNVDTVTDGINLAINSLDDELEKDEEDTKTNPFIENQRNKESLDFVNRPSVIPLPYGARERCITFSPSQDIVFVGLLSCRKQHQRRYCCLMACNILNGASRACKKINALLHRKECIYSIQLTSTNVNNAHCDDEKQESEDKHKSANKKNIYRLALGTNLGRLIVVTLKQNLSWSNTRKSFVTQFTIAFKKDPVIAEKHKTKNNNLNGESKLSSNKNSSKSKIGIFEQKKKNKHHRKTSSRNAKYSVLTSRERCFREMSDPITVMITYESMKKYLWNQSSQIDENDIHEFFEFMQPNKKNQVTFTQFVKKVDEDGDFMRAFEQFCLTGSSRTDRRAWMDRNDEGHSSQSEADEKKEKKEDDDSDWEFAMLNHRSNEVLRGNSAITAIAWSKYDNWIITGHQDGDIQFWSKEWYGNGYHLSRKQNKYLKLSSFYYVIRGSMKRHCDSITCLTLSGTYLVSSSCDGNILIWHLDFLLPSVSLPMNITSLSSRGIIQLLATISSAHLGDEICDVKLSSLCGDISYCIPNALYLLSCGADENIRCRDVMEILRQQLTLRILAESQEQEHDESNDIINNDVYGYPSMSRKQSAIHDNNNNMDESDGSDFGATEYN